MQGLATHPPAEVAGLPGMGGGAEPPQFGGIVGQVAQSALQLQRAVGGDHHPGLSLRQQKRQAAHARAHHGAPGFKKVVTPLISTPGGLRT